jgi:hypothetical protein
MRRLIVAIIAVAALVGLPATVAAECNGPDCGGSTPPVEGIVVLTTIAIILLFVAVMAAAEARRR